jgi:hypothetical protein
MEKLRSKIPLDHVTNAAIGPNKTQVVKITAASEVVLNFAMPTAATTIKFGTSEVHEAYHEFFIGFTPAPANVTASVDSATGAGNPWGVQVSERAPTPQSVLLCSLLAHHLHCGDAVCSPLAYTFWGCN